MAGGSAVRNRSEIVTVATAWTRRGGSPGNARRRAREFVAVVLDRPSPGTSRLVGGLNRPRGDPPRDAAPAAEATRMAERRRRRSRAADHRPCGRARDARASATELIPLRSLRQRLWRPSPPGSPLPAMSDHGVLSDIARRRAISQSRCVGSLPGRFFSIGRGVYQSMFGSLYRSDAAICRHPVVAP